MPEPSKRDSGYSRCCKGILEMLRHELHVDICKVMEVECV
jgi:hypothetical protein